MAQSHLIRRHLLLAILALAFTARLLVPAGWMPAPCGGLMPCDGVASAPTPAMHGHGGGHVQHHRPPATPTSADHPCAFVAPVAAPPPPTLTLPLLFATPVASAAARPLAVAVGRGLAAPPPPATGPPAFA